MSTDVDIPEVVMEASVDAEVSTPKLKRAGLPKNTRRKCSHCGRRFTFSGLMNHLRKVKAHKHKGPKRVLRRADRVKIEPSTVVKELSAITIDYLSQSMCDIVAGDYSIKITRRTGGA